MTFGLSGAAIGGIVGGLGTAASAILGGQAAGQASQMQQATSILALQQQAQNFAQLQALLKPYSDAGTGALTSQQNLIGVNGAGAQNDAINQIKSSSQYDQLNKVGQDAILQNASATGGLRGGNVQGALAQFSPQLLNQLIQQQYTNLGGLSSMGLQAGGLTAGAIQNNSNATTSILNQLGASQAGGALAQGKMMQGLTNSIGTGLGMFKGLGGSF